MNAMPSNADPSPENITRRDFLTLARNVLLSASAVIGLGALVRYLSFQPDPPPPAVFDLGSADQYPPGSRTPIPEARAVLLHTPGGFVAYSLVCPHLGCTLEIKPEAYLCPCHGSKFALDGALINGPANQPMEELRVEVTKDGRVVVYTG